MPWTLVYLPSEQAQLDSDAELLRASPDVESITATHRDSLLEATVRFHDELERTDDPSLIRIHALHRIGLPLRQWSEGPSPQPLPLTDEDKAALITRALASQEGRTRLAQAMASPIRRNLSYSSIARRALAVEPMPEGALPLYYPADVMDNAQVGDAVGRTSLFNMVRTEHVGPVGENVIAPGIAIDGPFGALARSGFGARVLQTQTAGTALVGGSIGLSATTVGNYLRLSGSMYPTNNGTWRITQVTSEGVTIENPNAWPADENIAWDEFYTPSPLGGLDQLAGIGGHVVSASNPWSAQSVYSSIAGYNPAIGASGAGIIIGSTGPTGYPTRENAREALRQALLAARVNRPDDSHLESVIRDFEAIVGRPLEMSDVPNLVEDPSVVPPKPTGWARVLEDGLPFDD